MNRIIFVIVLGFAANAAAQTNRPPALPPGYAQIAYQSNKLVTIKAAWKVEEAKLLKERHLIDLRQDAKEISNKEYLQLIQAWAKRMSATGDVFREQEAKIELEMFRTRERYKLPPTAGVAKK